MPDKPCRKCGATERTKRGDCLPCSRAAIRRWKQAHPGHNRETLRRWRKANPERVKELAKRWRPSPASIKRWAGANPAKMREIWARRRFRRKSATPAWLKASGQLSSIRELYREARRLGLHIDHDIPLAGCRQCGAVGLHVLANLRAIDPAANFSKRNRCTACF